MEVATIVREEAAGTRIMALAWLVGCGVPVDVAPIDVPDARSRGAVDDAAGNETPPSSSTSTSTVAIDSGSGPTLEVRDAIPAGLVGVERLDDSGTRKVFVRRQPDELFSALVVAEMGPGGWVEEVRIEGTPNPDRPAISPDGTMVAFVTGVSGLSSVWITPFGGGADPIQLTNVGLAGTKRAPGSPPPGFVPPPDRADGLTFLGDWLAWDSPAGPVSVMWRP